LRRDLEQTFASAGAVLQVTGVGSLMDIHPTGNEIRGLADLDDTDPRLRELLFLDLLEVGFYIAPRGYLALSVALEEEQQDGFVNAVAKVLSAPAPLYSVRLEGPTSAPLATQRMRPVDAR